jgi:hypothetical protein
MTTTTLTRTREVAVPPKVPHRHFMRDTIGWNRRATIYFSAVGVVCLLLERVHP